MNNQIFSKSGAVVEVKVITPEWAKYVLEHKNSHNSNMNLQHVKMLLLNMQNGTWRFNGDTICFAKNGELIDGQHRLKAIELFGKPVESIVVSELEDDAVKTIDQEAKSRSLSDVFSMFGVPSSVNTAAIVRAYFLMMKGNTPMNVARYGTATLFNGKKAGTIDEMFDYYYKNQEVIVNVVRFANNIHKAVKVFTTTEVGAYYLYLLNEKGYEANKIETFFDGVANGSAIRVLGMLRNKLEADRTSANPMTGVNKAALIKRAWNYYITGKETKVLQVPTDPKGIDFISNNK